MRLLAFFRGLFPRFFLRQGQWKDAVRVTNTAHLMLLQKHYLATVQWCKDNNFIIQSPNCLVVFRVWPEYLRAPSEFGIGKVLAPNEIPGDTHGTLLVRASQVTNVSLLIHESKHAITGISSHPKELFPEYRSV